MRRILIVSLLTLIPMGCRTDPSTKREIALLRSEILDLEDQFYATQAQLQACKGATGNVGSEYYVPQQGTGQIIEGEYVEGFFDDSNCETCSPSMRYDRQGRIIYNNNADEPVLTPPNSLSPGSDKIQQTPDSRRDRVIPEVPSDTRGLEEVSPQGSSYHRENGIEIKFDDPSDMTARSNQSFGEQLGPLETDPSEVITQIALNRSVSGGQDLDGVPGHEGLELLIQPQTQFGNVVQSPGELVVSAFDAGESQSRKRVGIWRFAPNEVKNFFVKQEYAERGILLHLPWDRITPTSRKLKIVVRYTTRDQRQLETSTVIDIEPPADDYTSHDALVMAWIEHDDRWEDNSGGSVLDGNDRREPDERFTDANPLFRATPVKTDRRIAPPQWRPVR